MRNLISLNCILGFMVILVTFTFNTPYTNAEDIHINFDISAGWNMISLPVYPYNAAILELFPNAFVVYDYQKGTGYIRMKKEDGLEIGKGYWILLHDDQNYLLKGMPINDYALSVRKDGWHMIGGCSTAAQIGIDQGNIEVIYTYDQEIGYQQVLETENLVPGKGYWVLLRDISTQIPLNVKTIRSFHWKLSITPNDVENFLNGQGPYGNPVMNPKLAVLSDLFFTKFYTFYQPGTSWQYSGNWEWKKFTSPSDVVAFLNGEGTYVYPVKDAQIGVLWNGHPEFYIFYQPGTPGDFSSNWYWKKSYTPSDVVDFLNGYGTYKHPVTTARITALQTDGLIEFYIFYQRSMTGDPIDNWNYKKSTTLSDVNDFINGKGNYTEPVKGYEFCAIRKLTYTEYYVFHNKGTKIWLQGPIFDERFIKDESIKFKAIITGQSPIDGTQLKWISNKDAVLGTGPLIGKTGLSLGPHDIEVMGYGTFASSKIRIFTDLWELYQSPPSQGEINRIMNDFNINYIDGDLDDEKWGNYPDFVFDQESTDPSKLVAICKLDILRQQRFSEPLPFDNVSTFYDYVKKYVKTINLRLHCGRNTGGNQAVNLVRSFSVWDSRVGSASGDPNACKIPFANPSLKEYINPLYLLVHEARHNDPEDPGHTSCNSWYYPCRETSGMDEFFEDGGGYAWAAIYLMWVHAYGLYDPPFIKQSARDLATMFLKGRFCQTPFHSDQRVQTILDEIIPKNKEWEVKALKDPVSVTAFLNETSPDSVPVAEAKISANRSGSRDIFQVFYRTGSSNEPDRYWSYKISYTSADAKNFLNGTAGYLSPVNHAMICGVWTGSSEKFYIFYRKTGEPVHSQWNVSLLNSKNQVLNFLNGTGSYSPKGRAQITSLYDGSSTRYYVFYKETQPGQAKDLWSIETFSAASQVKECLNNTYIPGTIVDGKNITANSGSESTKYSLFKPQGLLVVTRQMFEDTIREYEDNDYPWIQWKLDMGFETYLVTADWIDDQDYLSGYDIRYKIRCWLHRYLFDRNVRFAMLVGDSIEEPHSYPPPSCIDEEGKYGGSCPEPSQPVLSEEWNLPAGFHRWHTWEGCPQYTTLYYADNVYRTDNYYAEGQSYYNGSYVVNAGVVPIRTVDELENILHKSMVYTPVDTIHFNFSTATYTVPPGNPSMAEILQAIADIGSAADPAVTAYSAVFNPNTPDWWIYTCYFNRPNRVIFGSGHGSIHGFDASGTDGIKGLFINKNDISRFTSIIPGYIGTHCNVYCYMYGESYMESLLKAQKGPAVVLTRPGHFVRPSDPTYPLAPEIAQFWQDLFNGKTVGEAFYQCAHGAWQNPSHLFGDPSLVLFY